MEPCLWRDLTRMDMNSWIERGCQGRSEKGHKKGRMRLREWNGHEKGNGPKRRGMTRLGPGRSQRRRIVVVVLEDAYERR